MIDVGTVADVAAAVCFLAGSFLAFAAGVGAVRLPDLLSRMHAATKPQSLGMILMLLGCALRLRSGAALWALILVVLFQLLTAPVAAHMVGRAGFRTGKVRSDLLVVDELTADQADAKVERARADLTPEQLDVIRGRVRDKAAQAGGAAQALRARANRADETLEGGAKSGDKHDKAFPPEGPTSS